MWHPEQAPAGAGRGLSPSIVCPRDQVGDKVFLECAAGKEIAGWQGYSTTRGGHPGVGVFLEHCRPAPSAPISHGVPFGPSQVITIFPQVFQGSERIFRVDLNNDDIEELWKEILRYY